MPTPQLRHDREASPSPRYSESPEATCPSLKGRGVAALLFCFCILLTGCGTAPTFNPSFPIPVHEARSVLSEMEKNPKPFERPVIVLGGIHDPGLAAPRLARVLRKVSDENAIVLDISFFGTNNFDACRDRVLEMIEAAIPSDTLDQTVEVDVIGISMGGLVARYAADSRDDGKRRLRINRLFTVATPHMGASLAWVPSFDARVIDMRPQSKFLNQLDDDFVGRSYELFCYVRLDDAIVGAENAAPNGYRAWWVKNIPFDLAHMRSSSDPRIRADIAARLRGEKPYSTWPPAPLPGASAPPETQNHPSP